MHSHSTTGPQSPWQKVVYAYLIDVFCWFYTAMVAYKIVYNKWIIDVRYPVFEWHQALYALGVGGLIASFFFLPPGWSVGKRSMGLYTPQLDHPFWKYPYLIFGQLFLILTFLTGYEITQVDFFEFFSRQGLLGANRIFAALMSPNTHILIEAIELAIETIYMAFMATAFAVPVAFVLSFSAARNLMSSHRLLLSTYYLIRFLLNITRSMEPIVWAIIFSVWVGIGPFAGMLALFVHSIAALGKLYSEQIEAIDNGPLEAMTSTGANPIQVIWFGVVPQVVLPFLSFTIYRWDINVRMATIIGLVGGGGIGTLLIQYSQAGKWNEVGLLAMIIFAIVWAMDYSSSKIREAIK